MPFLTLEDFRRLALERGGECLSESYTPGRVRMLRFRCQVGHAFNANPYQVVRGAWCHLCVRDEKRLAGFRTIQEIAERKDGRCLSSAVEYRTLASRLRFECQKGHTWDAVTGEVKRGSWCAQCVVDSRRDSIGRFHQLARRHGGKCLSTDYKNNMTYLWWECAERHRWRARAVEIASGHWCPECGDAVAWTLEELRQLAWKCGGELLTSVYRNNKTKLQWRCHEGHVFWATANAVGKTRSSWCPECYHIRAGWKKAA